MPKLFKPEPTTAAPKVGDKVTVKTVDYPNARAHDRGAPAEYAYEAVVTRNMHPGDPMPDLEVESIDYITRTSIYPVLRNRTSPAARRGFWITPDAADPGEPAEFEDAFLEPPEVGDGVLMYEVAREPKGQLSFDVVRPLPAVILTVHDPGNPFSHLDLSIPVKSRAVVPCGARAGGGWFPAPEQPTSEPITEEKTR